MITFPINQSIIVTSPYLARCLLLHICFILICDTWWSNVNKYIKDINIRGPQVCNSNIITILGASKKLFIYIRIKGNLSAVILVVAFLYSFNVSNTHIYYIRRLVHYTFVFYTFRQLRSNDIFLFQIVRKAWVKVNNTRCCKNRYLYIAIYCKYKYL